MVRSIESKIVSDEVTVKGVDALGSDEPKRFGENEFVGTGPP